MFNCYWPHEATLRKRESLSTFPFCDDEKEHDAVERADNDDDLCAGVYRRDHSSPLSLVSASAIFTLIAGTITPKSSSQCGGSGSPPFHMVTA